MKTVIAFIKERVVLLEPKIEIMLKKIRRHIKDYTKLRTSNPVVTLRQTNFNLIYNR